MRKILIIAKTLIKSGGGGLTGDRRKRPTLMFAVVLIIVFATFAVSVGALTSVLFDGLSTYGVQGIMLPLVFGATSIVIFVFGVFYVISVMYHANDAELFGYLPIKPYQMLSAKFLTLVVYEYIFEAFILIPVLAVYGFKSGAGLTFILYSVILFLTTPVIALSMSAVIVMVLMRFTSFGKNKQVFRFIGGILALVFALGLNLLIQTSVRNIGEAQFIEALRNSNLSSLFGSIFPGIGFASDALAKSASIDGLLNLLVFLFCSAAAFCVFLFAGRLLYQKGVAGVTEITAKRKGVKDMSRETESSPAFYSYVKKELRLLLRSPSAFLNCVLSTFLWPVIIVIFAISGGRGNAAMIVDFIRSANGGIVIAVLTALTAFISCANSITSTAVSREGRSLYFMKYIPVTMRSQLTAKVMPGIIFSGISMILVMAMAAFIGVNILSVLIALILGIIVVAACSYIGIAIDASRPKLNWINEQQAIKQNLNVVLHILIGIALGAASLVPVIALNMSEAAAAAYNAGLFLLVLIIIRGYTMSSAALKLIRRDV